MLIERSYRLGEFLLWTRRTIYVLLVLAIVPVVLYEVVGWTWLVIPFSVVFLLGTTVALSAGFKNLQTYNRMQEAQQVWTSIASSSYAWGASCRALVADKREARVLIDRHLAWLAALRHEMRERMPWESQEKAYNVEYRKYYSVPEREQSLAFELSRYLTPDEAARAIESRNPARAVLALQCDAARRLLDEGAINPAAYAEFNRAFRECMDLQGKCERIKFYPYPRQHAFIHTVFVRILCLLLPFGMIGEFARLGEHMVWLAIPLSLVISWMYTSLDQVGESTENPFEGGANDVPIAKICEEVELDLRQVMGETGLPESSRMKGGFAL